MTEVFDFVGSVFDQSHQCLFLFLPARTASVLLVWLHSNITSYVPIFLRIRKYRLGCVVLCVVSLAPSRTGLLLLLRLNGEISSGEEEEKQTGTTTFSSQKVVVGYALTSKKKKSFLQPSFTGLAR